MSGHTISGQQLIAGKAVGEGRKAFNTSGRTFVEATRQEVAFAVATACESLDDTSSAVGDGMSRFLDDFAGRLEFVACDLVRIAASETGNTEERLTAELKRAVASMRSIAHISAGEGFADVVLSRNPDSALDLRRANFPIGPVAVFEAGNMPFFLGVCGSDAVAAWAAGCPVVLKAHPGHAGTSELIAWEALSAAACVGLPPGMLSLLQGKSNSVAEELVAEDGIEAVSFTGSVGAARSLSMHIAEREVPVPFYGEMGSTNPVFVTVDGIATKSEEIVDALVSSMGANFGQVCTKPSVVFVPASADTEATRLVTSLAESIADVVTSRLLSESVEANFQAAIERLSARDDVRVAASCTETKGQWSPRVFDLDYESFQAADEPWQELFGPAICVVRASAEEMLSAARAMPGQLTATVFCGSHGDLESRALVRTVARRVGRVVFNETPTGVAPVGAMHHGGPWPAASHPGFTSVGPASVRRFQRPVAFQNVPDELLPSSLFKISDNVGFDSHGRAAHALVDRDGE